jgi:hypothetical protein
MRFRRYPIFLSALFLLLISLPLFAAQGGNAGSIRGTVNDATGAMVPGAQVRLSNPLSRLDRTIAADALGQFEFTNVPFNTYRLTVTAKGFATRVLNLEVHSTVPESVKAVLDVEAATDTVTVEAAGDLVETDPTFHTDVDRDLLNKMPLESQSSALSSLVTLSTPGVAADSNGMFHGLGDHAQNSFSIDGQSITDQQSKTFSNQIPANSIQSLEVISGAPPAEYGGKTSLVIVATTRSGQGVTRPAGSLFSSYGAFGTSTVGLDLAYGGKDWGNFFEADGLNSGRFLDPPEFQVFHAKGNEQNVFDRIDRSLSASDSIHVDLNYSRSWFQTPNAYDNLGVSNVTSGGTSSSPTYSNVGDTDQRSKINTINFSPTFTRVLNANSVFNLGAFVRSDDYHYYPSKNPLADLGPIQTSSIAQHRTLTNAAAHGDISYAHGTHNFKAGVQYGQTFLDENDTLGIVSATLNAPCVDANGTAVAGYSATSECAAAGLTVNSDYLPVLAPYDLTRAGGLYNFDGHGDVKETALFVEDQIKAGPWSFNLGLRGDLYNGLTVASQAQPRLGISYNIKPSGTVLRASYARSLETPFNENLVLSSRGCDDKVLSPLLACTAGVSGAIKPGYRNEFHAGLQQALGRYLLFNGEYIWKYTHNAFDFSILGNTPITFPISWHNSKVPGWALHLDAPNYHNLSLYLVASGVAARFFPEQVAGAGATVGQTGLPFRIDHDEKFNQTTHLQYTLPRGGFMKGAWAGMNWRYDSGMVAGSAPCYNLASNDANTACDGTSTTLNGQPAVDLSSLTADQQYEAGLYCGPERATPGHALPAACLASEFGSTLINIPRAGTGDNDKNPPRIAPRNLFDMSLGKENIFRADRYKLDLDITAINVTDKYALYNFLSTFSGTHYVTPRSVSAKITLNF